MDEQHHEDEIPTLEEHLREDAPPAENESPGLKETAGRLALRVVAWAAGTLVIFALIYLFLWFMVFRYVAEALNNKFFLQPELSWALAWGVTALLVVSIVRFVPAALLGVAGSRAWTAYGVSLTVLLLLSYSWSGAAYFDQNGESERTLVRRDGKLEILAADKRDPHTGREVERLTPENLREFQLRNQYGSFADAPPVRPGHYFDEVSNEPKVWYSEVSPGVYDLFPLPGFDPRTGERLQAISREIVSDPVNQLRIYDARTGEAHPVAEPIPGTLRTASGPLPEVPPVYYGESDESLAAAPPVPAPAPAPVPKAVSQPKQEPKPEVRAGAVAVAPPPAPVAAPAATPPAPRQPSSTPARSTASTSTRPAAGPSPTGAGRNLAPAPADRRAAAQERDRALAESIRW